jgi:hypothetical protein
MLYPNLVSVIHAIAKKIGAYEKYNLQVIETPFKSGQATAGVEQLRRGSLDFYMGGIWPWASGPGRPCHLVPQLHAPCPVGSIVGLHE